MNSNHPVKRSNRPPTTKQAKLAELYNTNQQLPKIKQKNNSQLTKEAGYNGEGQSLAATACSTIRTLKKKGLIQSFENIELNEDYIANTLKYLIDNGKSVNVKASDAINALKLAMKARGDLKEVSETYEQTIKKELKGLTETQLLNRLQVLREASTIQEGEIIA